MWLSTTAARSSWLILSFLVGSTLFCLPAVGLSFEPTSPAVKLLAFRGIKYLESTTGRETQMGHVGGRALLAYTILKYHRRYEIEGGEQHPRVVKAIAEVRRLAKTRPGDFDVYQLSVGLNLLLEADTAKYHEQVEAMLAQLLARQRTDGSWSYPDDATGDTSQTQFAVLSLYIARAHNYPVPARSLTAACNWLLRTQDPSGSWGYHGNDPGLGNYGRLDQSKIDSQPNFNTAHSDTAAGAASLYIASRMLRLLPLKKGKQAKPKKRKSLTRVEKNDEPALTKEVNRQMLRERRQDADNWFRAHQAIPSDRWQYYYLYTLERYQTLREMTPSADKWNWYDEGVSFLRKQQRQDGRWTDNKGGPAVSTCFAILFLIRNTQTLEATSLEFVGGRINGPTANFGSDGAPPPRPLTIGDEGWRKWLNDRVSSIDPKKIPAVRPNAGLSPSEVRRARERQVIETLLKQPEADLRLETIRLLSRQKRNLDYVPVFIYALTDPDQRVVLAARGALRKWSRLFNGMGLPDGYERQHVKTAQQNWRRWYRKVRPDQGRE